MSARGRREEYAETTRAAIVQAAIERFTADGFVKASIDAVAESARVSAFHEGLRQARLTRLMNDEAFARAFALAYVGIDP
jgi:hypothetical protein